MPDAPNNQYLLIESAGLFWIGAEMAILFAMCEARRYFSALPAKANFTFASIQFKRVLFWILPLLGLCLWVACCQYFDGENRWQLHILTWCSFVIIWVFLECLIVWQGCAIYARLSQKLGAKNFLVPFVVAAAIFIVALSSPLLLALLQTDIAQENDPRQLVENGMYFLLRFAGVFWISVEWVAALVLVRAFFIFKRRVTA